MKKTWKLCFHMLIQLLRHIRKLFPLERNTEGLGQEYAIPLQNTLSVLGLKTFLWGMLCGVLLLSSLSLLCIFILFQDLFEEDVLVPNRFFFFGRVVWACSSFSCSWKTENAILFNTETFSHDEHLRLLFVQGVYLQQQPCSTARVNCKANQFWCRGPDVCDIQVFWRFYFRLAVVVPSLLQMEQCSWSAVSGLG